MTDVASNFTGSMAEHYDRIMGPAQFDVFGADLAGRLSTRPPGDVLEVACGTGIVTAGCASFGPSDYGSSEARTIQNVAYGTVQSVRPVRINADHAPVGTIAGAALGGVLGNSIGHGTGRGVATILGAVGGGLAGNAIEHNATAQNGEEIVVRLDNGSTVAVVQGAQGFERGQRVRVLTGPRGDARVEHA